MSYDKTIPVGTRYRIRESLPDGDGGPSCGMPGDIVEVVNYEHDLGFGNRPYVYINLIELSDQQDCSPFILRGRTSALKHKHAIYYFIDLLAELFKDYIEDQPQLEDDDL